MEMVSLVGLDVPAIAFVLFLQLDAEGYTFHIDDDRLIVRPKPDAETAALIRRYKPHFLAMVAYRPEDHGLPVDDDHATGV